MCLLQKSHQKCHIDISAVIEECQIADAHFSKRTVDREIRHHVRPSLPESVCFADFLQLKLSAHFTSLSYWNLFGLL